MAERPFHALPYEQQARMALDASHFGIFAAERGQRDYALTCQHALEDMTAEARGEPIRRTASRGARAIADRLAALDAPQAVRTALGLAPLFLIWPATLGAAWVLGGLMYRQVL